MKQVGDQGVLAAQKLVKEVPFSYTYDNYNAKMSTHVEQRPDAPSKVQSGTFSVIYKLYNARLEDMLLQPMVNNLAKAGDLTRGDISSTTEAMTTYQFQAQVHVVRALTKHHKCFAKLAVIGWFLFQA